MLCTCGGLHGALVLRELRASGRFDIRGVVRSTRVLDPHDGFLRGALAHVRRSGLAYAGYLWCATSLSDWLGALGGVDAAAGTAAGPRPAEFATRDLNETNGLRFLAACKPDIVISAFFNQRLHSPALALPRLGCVNIHPSLLPAARGVDPVFQSLLQGARRVGVTVHFMVTDLDSGPIIAQQAIDAPAGSSVFALTAQLFLTGAGLLSSTVDLVANGAAGLAQSGAGDYQSWPSREEMRAFHARGGRLVRLADLARVARGWPAREHRAP